MKNLYSIILVLIVLYSCSESPKKKAPSIAVDTDISNFWQAYDAITNTSDSIAQYKLLDSLYIRKQTSGLKAMMLEKRYTPKDYIYAINTYPKFWESVRANTLKSSNFSEEISEEIEKLKVLYPDIKPAKIYFTIGAMRSGGTTKDSLVLIGSEFAMADSTTVISELPVWLQNNLKPFFKANPIKDIVLLNVHEYVHTQQQSKGYNLLSQSLYEGVAEFVSVTSVAKPSSTPAIHYGKKHTTAVKERFITEMFSKNFNDWLYNNFENDFKVRDLGYYIGYAICEKYYEATTDKKAAIKEMITLDYNNKNVIEAFVDKTGYFKKSLDELYKEYETARPSVVKIAPFKNESRRVDAAIDEITIQFSQKMNHRFGSFNNGPDVNATRLPIIGWSGVSKDSMSFTYKVQLAPKTHYQLELSSFFRAEKGQELQPYLIDFTTR